MLLQFPISMGQNYVLPNDKNIVIDSVFFEKLKDCINNLCIVYRYDTENAKNTFFQKNLIGLATTVELHHDFIFINVDILNDTLLSLDNIGISLYCLPSIYYPEDNNQSLLTDYDITALVALI